MIKTGNDFMSENLCGLKFIGCGEDMLKLLEMMRVFEASPMFMKSPGTMMVAASA
ncbi:hypothetical protein L798_12986 [Zootermopsis nevadensis]|uniref:Uncharacterized protein n=2 Tax=Zootermopsis nevadensis TaxID=136037 RepID=A0A067R165_ZOONE|nr:hypothetical protein L798_12986 [Zootermopsis nevadensis]